MKQALLLSLGFVLSAFASAAEPVSKPSASTTAPSKPLNLRVGDIRKYMMPNEYRAALMAPEPDKSAIVVEGRRVVSPELQSMRAAPLGLGALFWGFANPASAWRIFVPDVNAAPAGPTLNKVPPPEFRWGP